MNPKRLERYTLSQGHTVLYPQNGKIFVVKVVYTLKKLFSLYSVLPTKNKQQI